MPQRPDAICMSLAVRPAAGPRRIFDLAADVVFARRVHETFDRLKRWHQGGWGRDDDGDVIEFDRGFHVVDTESVNSSMLAGIARQLEPDNCLLLPTVHMHPYAGVWIVFDDGPTATVHERNCDQADKQYRQLHGGRMMQMPSRQLAQEVLAELGRTEQPCEHCSPT